MTATKTRSSKCYDIAKDLVSQGHSVIRLENRGKKPVDPGWQKRNGNAVASTIEDVARLWQQGQAKNNVGIVMLPGVFVLDIDGSEGEIQLECLQKQYSNLLTKRAVQTASGAWHHLV